jgi:hypothetical protein
MSRELHRLVRSQILFREVNERLRDTDCIETVTLDLNAYERVRAHPNLFLVASGHEVLEVDRVIDQGDGYVLVEKIVEADEVIRADPRTRGD